MPTTYSRDQLFKVRASATLLNSSQRLRVTQLGLRRRGCRAGNHVRRSLQAARSVTSSTCSTSTPGEIPVIIGHRQLFTNNDQLFRRRRIERSKAVRTAVRRWSTLTPTAAVQPSPLPSLYVLNAAALSKPYAVQHLAADLSSYSVDVACITETHLKSKHNDNVFAVPGYVLLRRDRTGRRGGGVALYIRASTSQSVWTFAADDPQFELLWARIGDTFVGVLYHPPRPQYTIDLLMDYIEACIDDIIHTHPAAAIVLAGDFNQLSDEQLVERTGLTQIVKQPTRGANILDRIYVSHSLQYDAVRVVKSVVRSDHQAVVAYTLSQPVRVIKQTKTITFRKRTPTQHALFLDFLSKHNHVFDELCDQVIDTQSAFDWFYSIAYELLDCFYPVQTITITSRDPEYITPAVKSKLRRKNRLMHQGRIEEASALSKRIADDITKLCNTRLSKLDGRVDARGMWAAVRQLTGRKQDTAEVSGASADSFNQHYANISTDTMYVHPLLKQSANPAHTDFISEWSVFQMLDKLLPTATGSDELPAWFLRLGAPVFCRPITYLFNKSISTSIVPTQWKSAQIHPIPKVAAPKTHTDFRPISVTPVLSRLMEKSVVRHSLYPSFQNPPVNLSFADQFAYRPTGSTTSALIYLLHTITDLLSSNPFVLVIALDFSKAFDTVRHSSLLHKLSNLSIPDYVYNWLVDFFSDRAHSTIYRGQSSDLLKITASIIQGSGVGPAAFVVTAGDMQALTPGNRLCKYADDTYLIIPPANINTRLDELRNIDSWALANNMILNRSKSAEIIFTNRRRRQQVDEPPPLTDITRVSSIKILGVTISNRLSLSQHVQNVVMSCAQIVHALRTLRSHGVQNATLQIVFKSVAVAKLVYAASAWYGFCTAADRDRLEAVIRRAKRFGFCCMEQPSVREMVDDADDSMFSQLKYSNHVLHQLIPPRRNTCYHLRPRRHDCLLTQKPNSTVDSDFIIRMLFKDSY